MASIPLPEALEDSETDLYSLAGLTAFTIATIIMSFIALSLRFWAKFLSAGANFGLDDYLAFAAYPPAVAMMCFILTGHNYGLGLHTTENISLYQRTRFAQLLYTGEWLWHTTTSLLRFSVLAFYARIFHVRTNPSHVWVCFFYITLCGTFSWLLAAVMVEGIFPCNPISKFWDPSQKGTCIPVATLLTVSTIGCLVNDMMIVLLPLPQVFKLNLKWRKKMAVSCSFLLGYAAAFMSIGRLSIHVQLAAYITEDPFFFLTPYLYWDVAEAGFSILAVCLPAIFQLVKHVRSQGPGYLIGRKALRITSVCASADSTYRGNGRSEKFGQPGWDNLYEGLGFGTYVTVSGGTSAPARGGNPDPYALPLQGIAVRQDITIATTDFA